MFLVFMLYACIFIYFKGGGKGRGRVGGMEGFEGVLGEQSKYPTISLGTPC